MLRFVAFNARDESDEEPRLLVAGNYAHAEYQAAQRGLEVTTLRRPDADPGARTPLMMEVRDYILRERRRRRQEGTP
jgi:hypothetical protein